jgi:S-adenosylmethionine hydrolase
MPILTLTSEIGQSDFLVGAIKGNILSLNPTFTIVDISHSLTPFHYPEAAYIVKNAIPHFPIQSFHLVLVNLFQTPIKHLFVVQAGSQLIGIADNGLLSMIFDDQPYQVYAIDLPESKSINILTCVTIWIQIFNQLLTGSSLDEIATRYTDFKKNDITPPLIGSNYLEGHILYVDQFHNLIINITQKTFEQVRNGRKFKIVFKRDETIEQISKSYADVPDGEKLALFNTAGYLEIAIKNGKASHLFGLETYRAPSNMAISATSARMFYQMVRILFE